LTARVTSRTILPVNRPSGDPARRLRIAVDRLPRRTKEAMLSGIATNRIIVGAYVDPKSGGICPMLAAHRNGGRTDVAAFARAWDEYTNPRRPRRATRREVAKLRSLLEQSLDHDTSLDHLSIAQLAAQIRSEREALQERCGASRTRSSGDSRRRQRAGHIEVPEPLAIPDPSGDSIEISRRAPKRDLLSATERELTRK
jgi:hypothetical protein